MDYRRQGRYDVITVSKDKKLISPLSQANKNIKYFVTVEDLFDIIHDAYLIVGHGGRKRMTKELNDKYKNVTTEMIMLYWSLCEACQKKSEKSKRGLIVKPILATDLNLRCQVDLIDLQTQSDGDYKFIMNYQDHLTKFVILRLLKTKKAVEVASHLMEIFTTFGAPSILQSDNGRESVNKVIIELTNLWDGIKIVHGKPET
ncbi:KRAB-A domain-containing protein 2-like [Aphidius gifuensis]|uniref:KRAB-A domain-containing protein 2-like n=1 Tax=Aphidius gifuensis TaxID=684658 RepID=UPI001CDD1A6D|nr:KRAB-A domain-containing protein 2-like [Aphidius gifuensis]